MDKEILELLKAMHEDIKELKDGQQRIEKKLDAVVEQTADLTEFRTEMKEFRVSTKEHLEEIKDELNNVELITASNWKDIVRLKAVK